MNMDINKFEGTHPMRPENVRETPEFQAFFAEKKRELMQKYEETYGLVEEALDGLGERVSYARSELKESLDHELEEELVDLEFECKRKKDFEFAKRNFSRLCSLLESSKPIRHLRDIRRYKWTQHGSAGFDSDSGESGPHWKETIFENYFLQMQEIKLGQATCAIGIIGDMGPTLRIQGFVFRNKENCNEYFDVVSSHGYKFFLPKGNMSLHYGSNFPLNIETGIRADRFIAGSEIITPEHIKITRKNLRRFMSPAKKFVALVNRRYGEIESTLEDKSRVDII